ncbi:phage structural protein [Peribacillus castrilensis]|uniref:phage structural protein n=1 Tax=Bacillaceae TaxID=186817 RepID=UPI000C334543|nr:MULTISPECIES: DUF3277 domain-containing protein [Bacillaceae]MBD8590253.1 DUF3277 domain-containing protein [Peribacillus simplex]MDM5306343.1 DUF3277 domain-containing protein [Peribacillus frigoritolerans]PKF90543.1 DUF3277 domain-containing protein [Bacillus sp. BA3]
MTNSYTFDASQVSVVVDGRYLTDFAEGDAVQWEKDEDNFEPKVGVTGTVGITKKINSIGTITVLIMQGSPEVGFLKQLANTGKQFAIWVNTGGEHSEKIGGSQAMVLKTPEGSITDETGEREFEIKVFDYTDV